MKVDIESQTEVTNLAPPHTKARTPKALLPVSIALVATIGGLVVSGILPRINRQQDIARAQSEQLVTPAFRAQAAQVADSAVEIVLPASIEPVQDIPLYARADGYLKERLVDIGDRVKKGQLLAILKHPNWTSNSNRAKPIWLKPKHHSTAARPTSSKARQT